jgi:hypothetical protein
MEPCWFVLRGTARQGPLDTARLRHLVAAGQVTPDDLVWRQGMGQWVAVCRVPELLAPVPPAIPVTLPSPSGSDRQSMPADSVSLAPDTLQLLRGNRFWVLAGAALILAGLTNVMLILLRVDRALATPRSSDAERWWLMVQAALVPAVIHLGVITVLCVYARRLGRVLASRCAADLQASLSTQQAIWYLVLIWALPWCVVASLVVLLVVFLTLKAVL